VLALVAHARVRRADFGVDAVGLLRATICDLLVVALVAHARVRRTGVVVVAVGHRGAAAVDPRVHAGVGNAGVQRTQLPVVAFAVDGADRPFRCLSDDARLRLRSLLGATRRREAGDADGQTERHNASADCLRKCKARHVLLP